MQITDTLYGLYQQLAAAVSRRRGAFGAPVTVAEIYQELVPYRAVRDTVGFAMNADYEHTLLRLLAGEGDLVRLEPSAAADLMRRELRSPNPNVSMYREYAACDVWVAEPSSIRDLPVTSGDRDAVDLPLLHDPEEDVEGKVVATIRPEPAAAAVPMVDRTRGVDAEDDDAEDNGIDDGIDDGVDDGIDDGVDDGVDDEPWREAVVDVADANGAAASSGANAAAPHGGAGPPQRGEGVEPRSQACVFCDSQLPRGRQVAFCPYCGADQSKRPCSDCGEVLEPDWVYCIACGSNAR